MLPHIMAPSLFTERERERERGRGKEREGEGKRERERERERGREIKEESLWQYPPYRSIDGPIHIYVTWQSWDDVSVALTRTRRLPIPNKPQNKNTILIVFNSRVII